MKDSIGYFLCFGLYFFCFFCVVVVFVLCKCVLRRFCLVILCVFDLFFWGFFDDEVWDIVGDFLVFRYVLFGRVSKLLFIML